MAVIIFGKKYNIELNINPKVWLITMNVSVVCYLFGLSIPEMYVCVWNWNWDETFLKLKYSINHLKNWLSWPKLKKFHLISIKKDLPKSINNEDVSDLISNKTQDLMKFLKW